MMKLSAGLVGKSQLDGASMLVQYDQWVGSPSPFVVSRRWSVTPCTLCPFRGVRGDLRELLSGVSLVSIKAHPRCVCFGDDRWIGSSWRRLCESRRHIYAGQPVNAARYHCGFRDTGVMPKTFSAHARRRSELSDGSRSVMLAGAPRSATVWVAAKM